MQGNNKNESYGFLALALRQRLIQRWSLMSCTHKESVLEHSAVVAMLALLAGEIAKHNGKDVDIGKMLGHAICHDVSEVLTGDVVTPVKQANKALYAEFKSLEQRAEKKLLATLPLFLQEEIGGYFALDGYEKKLVKGCDIYAAYLKCQLEIQAGNKLEFTDALEHLIETLEEVKIELPEISMLDNLFGESFGLSVDKLLANGNT